MSTETIYGLKLRIKELEQQLADARDSEAYMKTQWEAMYRVCRELRYQLASTGPK